jgi:hypothetical protein
MPAHMCPRLKAGGSFLRRRLPSLPSGIPSRKGASPVGLWTASQGSRVMDNHGPSAHAFGGECEGLRLFLGDEYIKATSA